MRIKSFLRMNGSHDKTSAAARRLALSVVALLFPLAAHADAQGGGAPASPTQEDAAAAPQQGDDVTRPGQAAGGARLLARLNLSPQQREQIRAIRQEADGEGRVLARRFRQARRALDEAIYSENADEALVKERSRELATVQTAVARLRAESEFKVRRVLTPEQLKIFHEVRREARAQQQQQRRREGGARNRGGVRDALNPRPRPAPEANANNEDAPPAATASPSRFPRRRRGGGGGVGLPLRRAPRP